MEFGPYESVLNAQLEVVARMNHIFATHQWFEREQTSQHAAACYITMRMLRNEWRNLRSVLARLGRRGNRANRRWYREYVLPRLHCNAYWI